MGVDRSEIEEHEARMELLDVIESLLEFSRAGSLDELNGEAEVSSRARRILDLHRSVVW